LDFVVSFTVCLKRGVVAVTARAPPQKKTKQNGTPTLVMLGM
jgi:hypothetical protein